MTLADPAVGTGTFLLGALRRIADNVEADQGAGAVGAGDRRRRETAVRLRTAVRPVRGRAIAPARGNADADEDGESEPPPPELNLFITDTLGNPFVEEEQLPQIVEAIAKSRREANKVKREQPITVVIGNPPYKNKAGAGRLDRERRQRRAAPMDSLERRRLAMRAGTRTTSRISMSISGAGRR